MKFQCQVGPLHSRFGPDFPWEYRSYLAENMAIRVKNAQFIPAVRAGQWDGRKRFFAPATGSFYTGLSTWVETLLAKKGVQIEWSLIKLKPLLPYGPEPPSRITLHDYQQQIVHDAIVKQRGIIQAAVNAGKTEMALEIIRWLRLKTLYVVPSMKLYDQAMESFEQRLPSLPLGEIKAGVFAPELITVAMIQSLSGLLNESDEAKRWIQKVECIFVDEVHHAGSEKWSLPLKRATGAQYRYGLSATPMGMSQERDALLTGLTGPVFGQITTPDLVKRGLSVKTQVRFIKYAKVGGRLAKFSGRDYDTIKTYGIQQDEQRNRGLYKAILPHLKDGEKVCVFVAEIDHGNAIADLGKDFKVKAQCLYGTESKLERARIEKSFRTGKTPLLITTLFKEGVNIPEIDVIVNAAGGKSAWLTKQQGGRVLRTRKGKTKAVIYDFIDGAHRLLLGHSNARHRAYKEDFEIQLLDVT